MGESLPLRRSCRKGTSLYLHANSPALAVAVKRMTPVSAIIFGSKCHNSLMCKQSANQHVCCVQPLHLGGVEGLTQAGQKHGCEVEYSSRQQSSGQRCLSEDYAELCSLSVMFQVILS